jgi:transcriptional regulator with XRE-family HTH domain
MTKPHTGTLRAQWLGQILRQLREDKELTLKEVAEYLQRNLATVGRFEQGIYPVRKIEAAAMLDLYGVSDERQREVILQLAGEIWQTGWWEKYSKDKIWGSTIDYVWLENRSFELKTFNTVTVPGLLQTRPYAESLIEIANRGSSQAEIARWVQLRIERQQVLDRDTPLRLTAVLDEGALRRLVGGPEVMAGQLRHLVAMAQRPNIEIRLLPFTTGAHASPDGPFALLKMSDPFPEVVHIESPAGSIYLEVEDVARFAEAYDWLYTNSLDDAASVEFIAALEEDLS